MPILPELHPQKAKNRIAMFNRIIETVRIARKEPESAIGILSSAQTSVFGRIGRAMMAPLYAKRHLCDYYQALSLEEAAPLRRRDLALAHTKPIQSAPKHPRAERVAYTDSAAKTQISAAVCRAPETYERDDRLGSICESKNGQK